ncbi:hypothetical protein R3I94_010938 [Phoxinus phoxinus]
MLPLPGLVDKLIDSPSKKNSNCMCVDTKKKSPENLWQDRNIVRDSGILSRLSKEKLKLQEHLYEVVTSEQTYHQSLSVAVEHFQESPVLKEALAPRDRKSLFSSIAKIKEISQRLDQFVVQDYVHRSLIEVTEGTDLEEELEGCELNRIFQLALSHNHRSTTSQLLLQTNSEAEKDLWVDLLGGRRDGQDTVYEEWDCPQVRYIEVYNGQQQGELSLQLGDMINIIQNTTDGFLEGRRIQGGQRGWFSAACVVEITNEHVQRRHLRQRYHVLQTATRLLKQRSGGLEQRTTTCFK